MLTESHVQMAKMTPVETKLSILQTNLAKDLVELEDKLDETTAQLIEDTYEQVYKLLQLASKE